MRIDVEDIPDWKGGFDYCRRLVNHGFYPDESLEVFRKGILCYTVKSFFEGAKLTVDNERVVPYRAKHEKKPRNIAPSPAGAFK